nr:EOG090X0TJE [Eulimnadia texana]
MKFRAKMVDGACIKQFMSIVGTMAKLGKTCAIRITTEEMCFIIHEAQSLATSPMVWCAIAKDHLFLEFDMEGLNSVDNEILLEFESDNVSRVSSSKVSSSAKSVKIKLTKKRVPCLTFEIDLPSENSRSRLVVHDIPVNLISRRLWGEYQQPDDPGADIRLVPPPLRVLRNIVERMKHLANMATVYFNKDGDMSITAETSMVSVTSHFENLQIDSYDQHECSVTLDLKKFSTLLLTDQLSPNRVTCSGTADKSLHFSLQSDSFVLQYILPAVSQGI